MTNTRAASLTIGKVVFGNEADDSFDLTVDGAVAFTPTAENPFSDEFTLEPGTYTIAESAGPDTDLSDYTSTIECENFNDPDAISIPITGPAESNSLDLNVFVGDRIVRRIINVEDGTVLLAKEVEGDPGDDTSDLTVNGEPALVGAVDGSTGDIAIPIENSEFPTELVTVAESAGPNTNLADYTSEIICVFDEGGVAVGPVIGPAETNSLEFFMEPGLSVLCVIHQHAGGGCGGSGSDDRGGGGGPGLRDRRPRRLPHDPGVGPGRVSDPGRRSRG
ncbi:MAG: hypothetical protein ACRDZ3_13505 [Acidimicrobiia bacterium]